MQSSAEQCRAVQSHAEQCSVSARQVQLALAVSISLGKRGKTAKKPNAAQSRGPTRADCPIWRLSPGGGVVWGSHSHRPANPHPRAVLQGGHQEKCQTPKSKG